MRFFRRQFSLLSLLLFMLFAGSLAAAYVRRNPWVLDRVENLRPPGGGTYFGQSHNLMMRANSHGDDEILDVNSGEIISTIPGKLQEMGWSSRWTRCLYVNRLGNAYVLDGHSGKILIKFPYTIPISGNYVARISVDGKRVVLDCDDGLMRVFDIDQNLVVYECPSGFKQVLITATVLLLHSADHIKIIDLQTRSELNMPCKLDSICHGLSSDGSRFYLEDDAISVINTKSGNLEWRHVLSSKGEGADINFSKDGTLFGFSLGAHVEIWNTRENKAVLQVLNSSAITSTAISPDNQILLLGGADNVPRIWKLATSTFSGELAVPPDSYPYFAENGKDVCVYKFGLNQVWVQRFPDHPGGHFTRPEVWLSIVTGLAWLINLFRSRRNGPLTADP
jgi:hypothetical protein